MKHLDLLDWYNAIFFVPMAASALLLILSSIRLGSHHSHAAHSNGGGGHNGASTTGHAHATATHAHVGGHGAAHHAAGTATASRAQTANAKAARSVEKDSGPQLDPAHPAASWAAVFAPIFGFGRAPALMMVELYFLAFGLIGLLANGTFIHTQYPWLSARFTTSRAGRRTIVPKSLAARRLE
jgi:hypothetical protein